MKKNRTQAPSREQLRVACAALGHDPNDLDAHRAQGPTLADGRHRNKPNAPFVAFVETMLISGRTDRDIMREGREQFGYKTRSVRNVITKCRRRLAASFQKANQDIDSIRAQGEAMMLEGFQMAKGDGDPEAMVRITESWLKLHGAQRPDKVDVNVRGIGDMLDSVLNE